MQLLAVFPALFAATVEPSVNEMEPAVVALFEDACTMCHDESDDNIDLEGPLSQHVGAPSSGDMPMITPGDPDKSYLFVKIAGGPHLRGDLMPLEDDPLSAEQIALVRNWISALPADAAPPSTDDSGDTHAPEEEETEEATTPAPAATSSLHAFPGTHQVALHTTTTLGRRGFEFRVHHRFGRVGNKRSYGGLRDGATISLGSAYGILDNLDVLLRFSTTRLDWELGGKYVPLQQEAGRAVSLGLYASMELLTEERERAANRFTGNFQAMVSRLWIERIATQATLGYSLLTNHSPNPMIDFGEGPEPVEDRRATLNAGLAATFLLGKKRRHGIDVEYILPVPVGGDPDLFYFRGGDADPSGSKIGSWSLGWSGRAGLHLFQVFLTNNRNIHTNLVAPGGDLGNPFAAWGEFFLGFNLSRKWKW